MPKAKTMRYFVCIDPSCPQALFSTLLKRLMENHNGIMGRTRIVMLKYGESHPNHETYKDHKLYIPADWHSLVSIQTCVFNPQSKDEMNVGMNMWVFLDGYVQGQVQAEVNTPIRNAAQGIIHSMAPSMASIVDGYFHSKNSEDIKLLFLLSTHMITPLAASIPAFVQMVDTDDKLPKDLFPSPEKRPGAFNLLRAIVSTTQANN